MRLVHIWPVGVPEIRRDMAQALKIARRETGKPAREAREYLREVCRTELNPSLSISFFHDSEEPWRILSLMHKENA